MIVDVAIVIILVIFCVRSFRGGVAGELKGALGWLVAILAAIGFSEPIGDFIAEKVPKMSELSPYVSFLVIVVILRLLFMGLLKHLPEKQEGSTYVVLNIIAVAAGFFKGAFFVSVVLLLLSKSDYQPTIEKYAEGGVVYPHIKEFSAQIVNVITEKVPNVEALLEKLS